MMTNARSWGATLGIVLILSLGVPTALLVQPHKAQATLATIELSGIATLVVNALHVVKSALIYAVNILEEALMYYEYIKLYVLDPLTYIESGKATQALTGGALAFISGSTNGTGQSQFVQNVPGHLQGAGDNAVQAFLRNFNSQSNSPYARSISSSLRTNYLEQSSVAGFFAANRDTLPQFSNNPTAFLAGNWSQGGVGAWFALTTQPQNNPYILRQMTEGTLGKLVDEARETQDKILNWGKGFLSWCGEGAPAATNAASDPNCNVSNNYCGNAVPVGGDTAGANPGAGCTQKDGTPGIVKTPGSTITSYLDKSLGLNADKINMMGDASTQITSIIGSITQIVQMSQEVLGGPQGGLAGVGSAQPGQRSLLDSYSSPGSSYGGISSCIVEKQQAQQSPTNGQSVLDNAASYLTSWKTIGAAAQAASTSVITLKAYCAEQILLAPQKISGSQRDLFIASTTEIINDAQYALDNNIAPLLAKAKDAARLVASSTEFVLRVRAEMNPPVCPDPPVDHSADVRALRTTPPTNQDMGEALADADTLGSASTSPMVSLRLIEGKGTKVDQMKLLSAKSVELKAVCTVPKPRGGGGLFGGFF